MNRPPIYPAFIAMAVMALPFLTDGQIRLFKPDPEAQIIRKAKRYNLASIKEVVPGAFIDMRYKITSAANKPLYTEEMPCLAHRSTAAKLKRANAILNKSGYAIKIWDAWRPPEAQQALWDAVQDPKFVVPPSRELSWHCYGISIDLTLVKLDGTPVTMPSRFDEFSDRAASDYVGGDPAIAERVNLLQQTMRSVGFRTIRSEWWHFDDMSAEGGVRRVNAADLGIRMP